LGNNNGTFQEDVINTIFDETITFNQTDSYENIGLLGLAVGDFNNDNYIDLVFYSEYVIKLGIFFGNNDGTFQEPVVILNQNWDSVTGIVVADFNKDNNLDIAASDRNTFSIYIFFGCGNGTFLTPISLYTGDSSFPAPLVVSDLNNDGNLDIIVLDIEVRLVGVFLGHGNGEFEAQKKTFTSGGIFPVNIYVSDFNNDRISDLIISYGEIYFGSVMFGYENGTFGGKINFISRNYYVSAAFAIGDFNDDSHMDIAFGPDDYSGISILLGDGNGNFQISEIISTNIDIYQLYATDFNNDGHQDIITFDYSQNALNLFLNAHQCEQN
jgi:hypothetical protein